MPLSFSVNIRSIKGLVSMERYVVLEKKYFNDFISEIAKKQKVVAPVAKGYQQYSFEEVTSGD